MIIGVGGQSTGGMIRRKVFEVGEEGEWRGGGGGSVKQ